MAETEVFETVLALDATDGSSDGVELGFGKGDYIVVLKKSDEWWYGECQGRQGWFSPAFGEVRYFELHHLGALLANQNEYDEATSEVIREEDETEDGGSGDVGTEASTSPPIAKAAPLDESEDLEDLQPVFTANVDHEAEAGSSELSYHAGEQMIVLAQENGWIYGEKGNERGWFQPGDGKISMVPRCSLRLSERLSQSLFDSFHKYFLNWIHEERRYAQHVASFVESFVKPLELRDTVPKRKIMEDVSISGAIAQVAEIHLAQQQLQRKLTLAEGLLLGSTPTSVMDTTQLEKAFDAISDALSEFSPCLSASYAEYCECYTETVEAVARLSAVLGSYLRDFPVAAPLTLDQYVALPIKRYKSYKLLSLSMRNVASELLLAPSRVRQIQGVAARIDTATVEIDERVQAANSRLELLALQSKFLGKVQLYRPERNFIMSIRGLKLKRDGKERKRVTLHLFNDALTVSVGVSQFKLYRVFSLKEIDVFQCAVRDGRHELSLGLSGADQLLIHIDEPTHLDFFLEQSKSIIDQAQTRASMDAPPDAMDGLVSEARSSFSVELLPTAILPQVEESSSASKRVGILVSFMNRLWDTADCLMLFATAVSTPLLELAAGKACADADIVDNADGVKNMQRLAAALSLSGSRKERRERAALAEKLRRSSAMLALRCVRQLETVCREAYKDLASRLKSSKSLDDSLEATALLSPSIPRFHIFERYVSGYIELERILRLPLLQPFCAGVAEVLGGYTAEKKNAILATVGTSVMGLLHVPLGVLPMCAGQIESLLRHTSEVHPDHRGLEQLNTELKDLCDRLVTMLRTTQTLAKLSEIKDSLVLPSVGAVELQSFVSAERRFIKEGLLRRDVSGALREHKVWLCNDLLLFGEPLPYGFFRYRGAVELDVLAVELGEQKHSIQARTREVLFLLHAATSVEMLAWLDALSKAIVDRRHQLNVEPRNDAARLPGQISRAALQEGRWKQSKMVLNRRPSATAAAGKAVRQVQKELVTKQDALRRQARESAFASGNAVVTSGPMTPPKPAHLRMTPGFFSADKGRAASSDLRVTQLEPAQERRSLSEGRQVPPPLPPRVLSKGFSKEKTPLEPRSPKEVATPAAGVARDGGAEERPATQTGQRIVSRTRPPPFDLARASARAAQGKAMAKAALEASRGHESVKGSSQKTPAPVRSEVPVPAPSEVPAKGLSEVKAPKAKGSKYVDHLCFPFFADVLMENTHEACFARSSGKEGGST
eukprot:scaffold336_cov250-Pinguiococcus_pyrenoidosus.AAC.42